MSAPVIIDSPAAELLAQVAADPHAPMRVAIGAPGGHGKTELLRELAAVWQRAGVAVATPWQAAGPTDEQVLLADDAHRLDPIKIQELRAYADNPAARLVVTYRPWPRPDGLPELIESLRRMRQPLRLPAMSPAQVRDRLAAAVPDPSHALVAVVAEQTGGVPRYVARVASALTPADVVAGRIPVAALAGFAPELDDLEPDVRTLLLAAEAGAGLSFDLVAALLDRDAGTVADLVDAGRATGLLAADGTLLPLARRAIAALGPIGHRIDVRQRLAALQLARGGPVLPLVRQLLRDGGLVPGAGGGGFDAGRLGPAAPGRGGVGLGLGASGPGLVGLGASGAEPGAGGLGAGNGGPNAEGLGAGGGRLGAGGLGAGGGGLGAGGLGAGGGGLGSSGLGPVYEAAGEEALGDDPRLAAELFAAAAGAGRGTAVRRALATALAGDLDEASRLADQALAAGTPEQRAEAAYVAAAVLTQRGQTAQAAALYQWSPTPVSAGFGAVGLIGTGQPASVPVAGPGDGPPSLLSSAAALMARGMAESVGGAPTTALSSLVQASMLIEPAGPGVLLPDTPAALGATIALHCAELDTADALLARAVHAGTGGALLADRHRLLQIWVLMQRGRVGEAQALLLFPTGRSGPGGEGSASHAQGGRGQFGDTPGVGLEEGGETPGTGVDGSLGRRGAIPGMGLESSLGRHGETPGSRLGLAGRPGRDRLFAGALRAGLSRRAGDLVGLRSCWPDACHALIGQPIDLFTLLPLGELTIAAARLGEQHRVAGHLAEADRLLAALGDPPLWSAPLHWSRLHAAILTEDREAAARHTRALVEVRDFSPYSAAVATAAERWLDVLDGRAEPDAVVAAAHGLAALGLIGEGARLVGQAAIRTADRKAMTLLLESARALQDRVTGPGEDVPATGGRVPQLLSEREREVAGLILAGLTYKQIAERLYLSAKTVEHHVARIRNRLGVTGRQELLTRLRALISAETEPRSKDER